MNDQNSPSHKRSVNEVRASGSFPLSPGVPSFVTGESQHHSKRPRISDYREQSQDNKTGDFSDDSGDEDDDDDDSDRHEDDLCSLRRFICLDRKPSIRRSDSNSSQDETTVIRNTSVHRTASEHSRWILRRDSTFDSISSVLTDASEVATAMVVNTDNNDMSVSANTNTVRRSNSLSAPSHHSTTPPIETLVRNLETWSLTHIRAMRRNNLFDAGTFPQDKAHHRRAVQRARSDVMRTLRRGSSALSSDCMIATATTSARADLSRSSSTSVHSSVTTTTMS
jgi:hypothetical protein